MNVAATRSRSIHRAYLAAGLAATALYFALPWDSFAQTLVYDAIDAARDFYRGHAEPDARSLMNVTFRLPTAELEAAFVAEAAERGMVELRGHRSVGGIRASLYNAMPRDGVEALVAFMEGFHERHAP